MPFPIPLNLLWLALMVILVLIEAATMGLTCIWFAAGALFGYLMALVGLPPLVQLFGFVAASALALLYLRPFAAKYLVTRQTPTNADRVLGAQGVVTQTIDDLASTGQVRVYGQVWTARAAGPDTVIPEGTLVKVEAISGVKLMVSPIAETANI